MELALIITGQIAIFFSFLLFNFPKAKIFLGDSGAYTVGALTGLNVIITNNLNPKIPVYVSQNKVFATKQLTDNGCSED